jgi:hypothetical protein
MISACGITSHSADHDALVLADHRSLHHGHEAAHELADAGDLLADHRVALLRHRRRSDVAVGRRLRYLGHLRRLQPNDLERDLLQGRGKDPERRDELCEAVPGAVPGGGRLGEIEAPAEGAPDGRRRLAERCQRPGGPAQLSDEQPRPARSEALRRPRELGDPDRELEAEGDGNRVLAVRPAGHCRGRVPLGVPRQLADQLGQRRLDQIESGARLQDGAGVHDVLGGGAPVDVATRVSGFLCERADGRHERMLRLPHPLAQLVEVEGVRPRDLTDPRRGRPGDDAGVGFGFGESDLHVEPRLQEPARVEHGAHPSRAEHVAKQAAVEGRRHKSNG